MELLVAFDGSREAETALAYATDIAEAMEGSITVVHAVHPDIYEETENQPITRPSDVNDRLLLESVEDAENRGLDILDDAVELAEELGHDVETVLLYGNPVTEITDYADESEFDAIFVGHRGRSERTERMLGSVAKAIVGRATVPVTVVR